MSRSAFIALAIVGWLTFTSGLRAQSTSTALEAFVAAALDRTKQTVRYDGRYISIDYPGGDVPANIGVCTDVVVRSYRQIGIDLQELVHEDMSANFTQYPALWGLSRPDPNIDHRRVPNLRVFFERHGTSIPPSDDPLDYLAGDIVTWMLPGNLPHIGIVVSAVDERGGPMIVHNIGRGPQLEAMLFDYTVTGHYRYSVGNSRH